MTIEEAVIQFIQEYNDIPQTYIVYLDQKGNLNSQFYDGFYGASYGWYCHHPMFILAVVINGRLKNPLHADFQTNGNITPKELFFMTKGYLNSDLKFINEKDYRKSGTVFFISN